MKSLENIISKYEDIIYDMYWNQHKNFVQISNELNLASAPTLYRYMFKHSFVRTHEEQLKDLKNLNTGRKWSKEARKNVSDGVKKSYNNPELRKKRSEINKRIWSEMTKEEKQKRVANGLKLAHEKVMKLNSSSIEDKVAEQLTMLNVRYIRQKCLKGGKFYIDFYIPSLKLVIECNGDYWHNLPNRIERDKELKEYVESTGRRIIFIWEHEINDDWFWVGDYLEI